jgi:hypothetical protein
LTATRNIADRRTPAGNNSLLIDRKDDSYLFKQGFFDENILALNFIRSTKLELSGFLQRLQ